MTTLTIEQLQADPEQALAEWQRADKNLKAWKVREAQLRAIVVAARCDATKEEGTQNVETTLGTLNVVKTQDYKLDNKENQIQLLSATLPIADQVRFFKWDAKLQLKAYRDLKKLAQMELDAGTPGEYVALLQSIEEHLTIKAGMPQVKLKAKKK